MAKHKEKKTFWANQIVKVPVKVRFRTSGGGIISFGATKAVKRRRKVSFYSEE